ncbi:hypothetical protein AC249_AIPGENE10829 [Exaiptasia diaphana]|nr:hypothetical protein AC249_AIPGENE10829 [Exaiptasia diaphana]
MQSKSLAMSFDNIKVSNFAQMAFNWFLKAKVNVLTILHSLFQMSNLNGSSSAGLQFLMQELIKGSSVFTNKRVVIHSLFLILNEIKRRYSPITKDNDIDVVILCEALYNSIRDLNTRKPLKGEAYNSYCGVLGEVEQNKR